MAYIKIHRVPDDDGTRCFGYMRVEFTLTDPGQFEWYRGGSVKSYAQN